MARALQRRHRGAVARRELQGLLTQHMTATGSLAGSVAVLEAEWLGFANSAQAKFLPGALDMLDRIDRLRSSLVGDLVKMARVADELEKPKVTVEAQVLVLQDRGRREEQ